MSRAGGVRLEWVEAGRMLSCALVVLVHANIAFRPGLDAWWPDGIAGVPVYSLPVPIFFALAGFLAERRPPPPGASRAWVAGRLLRILPPMVVWSAILLATGVQDAAGPLETAFFLAFGARHLYFLSALAGLVALHAWLRPRLSGRALASLAGAATVLFFAAADVATWRAGAGAEAVERVWNRLPCAWSAFYAAGAWLGRSDDGFAWIARWRPALLTVAAVSYAGFALELSGVLGRFGFHPVRQFLLAALPLEVAGTLLVLEGLRTLAASHRWRATFARLAATGSDTFGIYVAHVSAQGALFALAWRLGYRGTSAFEVPVLAAASWGVCRAGIALARRILPPRAGAVLLGITPA